MRMEPLLENSQIIAFGSLPTRQRPAIPWALPSQPVMKHRDNARAASFRALKLVRKNSPTSTILSSVRMNRKSLELSVSNKWTPTRRRGELPSRPWASRRHARRRRSLTMLRALFASWPSCCSRGRASERSATFSRPLCIRMPTT